MNVVAPPPQDELELLIREARARQRRRRLIATAVVVAAAGLALAIASILSDGSPRPTATRIPSTPSTNAASGCGFQVEGTQILRGREVAYREPVFRALGHELACSGRTAWVVFFNGVGSSQEAYFGVHSSDGGRTWRAVFMEGYFGPTAPHQLVTGYLGPWTLAGSAAYFTGYCVACYPETEWLWVTRDGGRTFHRYALPPYKGKRSVALRVSGHTVTVSTHTVRVS